ncbi:MAG: hypothetical protein HP492_13855 [Nitrospira sp.]|nr:hypothetical protein [Nitrospira sp.]
MAVFSQAPSDGLSGIARSRNTKVCKVGRVVDSGIGPDGHLPLCGLKAVSH